MTPEVLKAQLEAADEAYYINDNPTLTDAEYDKLVAQYKQLTGETWVKLGRPSEKLTRIPHVVPMLSLDKKTSSAELAKWVPMPGHYTLMPKIDGLSAEWRFTAGLLQMAVSRGDGTVGESVLHSMQNLIRGGHAPETLTGYTDPVQVRGEIYLPKALWALHFGHTKNPRNTAAGLVRRQEVHSEQQHLRFIAYRVIGPEWDVPEQLAWLAAQGFEVPPSVGVGHSQLGTMTAEQLHPDSWAGELPYEIDGVVVVHNSLAAQQELGETGSFPKWACAYKFATEEKETELLAVEWNASRTGAITPVYVFRAVQLCGTIVSRATGHNLGQYQAKGARVGDTIVVRKSNEIIPEVVRVVR